MPSIQDRHRAIIGRLGHGCMGGSTVPPGASRSLLGLAPLRGTDSPRVPTAAWFLASTTPTKFPSRKPLEKGWGNGGGVNF